METDDQAPKEAVPANGTQHSGRMRRWAKSISAIIAALGVASAAIGYLTNGAQFFSEVTEFFQGRSELHSLTETADERLAHKDYEAAWRANAKARQLGPRNAVAAEQQARIAMRWLEDVHLGSAGASKMFTEVVDPLKAALIEQLPGAHGQEKANLQAHIGWANFLRFRDGKPEVDILEEFNAAIVEDPDNLYGHVMRGFWTLWKGTLDRARPDLDAALRSTTDPAFSDRMILAALTNKTSDEFMVAAIEYADKIRRAGRKTDDHTKGRLLWYYFICLHDSDLLAKISKTLPADSHIALLRWLAEGEVSTHDKRVATYFMAHFAEVDGKKDEALRFYENVVGQAPDSSDDVARLAQADLRRLQKR